MGEMRNNVLLFIKPGLVSNNQLNYPSLHLTGHTDFYTTLPFSCTSFIKHPVFGGGGKMFKLNPTSLAYLRNPLLSVRPFPNPCPKGDYLCNPVTQVIPFSPIFLLPSHSSLSTTSLPNQVQCLSGLLDTILMMLKPEAGHQRNKA